MPFFRRNQPNTWTSTSSLGDGNYGNGNVNGPNSNFGTWGSNSNGYSNGYGANNNNYGNDVVYEEEYVDGYPVNNNAYNSGNGTYNGYGNNVNSGRNRGRWYTPFGTPGFASENLLSENPWTHNTLGYDYYDYFADQRVRGPFGVAPGSVVPPSQRHLFGGRFRRNRNNNNMNNNGYAYGSSGANGSGLNRGIVPPGAAVATTNQPIQQQVNPQYYERELADGSIEHVQQETYQTTQQDVVPNARGVNGGRWASRKGITTTGVTTGAASNITSNVPSTMAQSQATSNIIDETVIPQAPPAPNVFTPINDPYYSNALNEQYGFNNYDQNAYNNVMNNQTGNQQFVNNSNYDPNALGQQTLLEKRMETSTVGSGLPLASTNTTNNTYVAPTRAI